VPENPRDLVDHRILQYANSDSKIWYFMTPDGRKESITLPASMVANNGDFLKNAALSSHGIIMTPTFITWQELCDGKLVPLLCDYEFSGLNAYAVYPQTRHLPRRVRMLIDFLTEKFGGEPYWDQKIYQAKIGQRSE